MHVLRDNGEDDNAWVNCGKLSLPLGEFMFAVLFMFIPCSKLTNCFISTLRTMIIGEDSQTTAVQISCCAVLAQFV